MGKKKATAINEMVNRICDRKDYNFNNVIKTSIIKMIIRMFLEECRKALLRGERIELSGIGTIIPEVKTHRNCYLPTCNNDNHENAPYTRIRMTRTDSLKKDMNETLFKNIENGIYGLEKLPFDIQQINNLKANGYILSKEDD